MKLVRASPEQAWYGELRAERDGLRAAGWRFPEWFNWLSEKLGCFGTVLGIALMWLMLAGAYALAALLVSLFR